MNERELKIAKAILRVLNDRDGQMVEAFIHAEACLIFDEHIPLALFNSVLHECDRSGWVIGVKSKLGRQMKWQINDVGRGALLEMQ